MTAPRRTIGNSDLSVYPLSLGGNVFGWTADRETSFAVLDGYSSAGGNFVDTADGYSAWVPGNTGGDSERILGEWFEARGNRDDIVLATKVSQHPGFKGLAGDNILRAADASLERLRTDHIDLYYAHFDDQSVPLEETVTALSSLVDAGKVRYIAISNYSPERIEEWFRITEANGLHRPVALQPHYNLVERGFEDALLGLAERENLGVVPYFSLAARYLRSPIFTARSPSVPARAILKREYAPCSLPRLRSAKNRRTIRRRRRAPRYVLEHLAANEQSRRCALCRCASPRARLSASSVPTARASPRC